MRDGERVTKLLACRWILKKFVTEPSSIIFEHRICLHNLLVSASTVLTVDVFSCEVEMP